MHHDEWKLIYESYAKALYLYALSLTGNTQDAEDLLQETFVKAFLSYESTGSIKYWLIIVLRNEFYNLKELLYLWGERCYFVLFRKYRSYFCVY